MSANLKRTSSARESVSPPPSKRKVESTTTSKHIILIQSLIDFGDKAVANFFTPASKKEPDRLVWRVVDESLLIGTYAPKSDEPRSKRTKIAAFDLDSTLITTKSGKLFSQDASDWQWWNPSVLATLRQLYIDGYIIAVLTNQGRLSLKTDSKSVKQDQRSLVVFKSKVNAVLNHFDFPIILLAATGRDKYRKPRMGMWNELLEDVDLDIDDGPDLAASFFVGDAGGRPATSGVKADHSCSDRDLATNIGIEFKTPEEFFLEEKPRSYSRIFDPREFLDQLVEGVVAPITKENPLDVVTFCGSPAAGKSTFFWTALKPMGYERVNQDILKSRLTSFADNTNADIDTRAVWVQLAKKFGIPIRCIYFTAPAKLCEHNDTVRALAEGAFNPEKRQILPHSAFTSYASRFQEPSLKEGFHDITKIDFKVHGSIPRILRALTVAVQ
ncbi:MAG: hypothetical protein Q9195_008367 [Heterodermia aff. obscurata]